MRVYASVRVLCVCVCGVGMLTGVPKPDDVIEYVVPMCGPYAALKDFKYKVKITPGTTKRGKAVKVCLTNPN